MRFVLMGFRAVLSVAHAVLVESIRSFKGKV